ncbi:tail fiber domain-containing protein [Bacteroides nordii]|uniref:tail fiber domain-containing protein n=1 Tax=Bacteroides nordii TaxID=291645 RepID=UPI0034A0E4D8
MIHIKDISGNIILSVSISQECEHVEELMKSDYIQLSWSSDNSDTIPAGSYIEYKGEKYSLLEPYSPKQKDEAEFIYQPQFQSKIMIWGKTPFFMYTYTDDVITNREPDWSLTDNPANFMSVVVDAIKNETGEIWTYSVESSLPASTTQSFQSIDIFSALNQIANAFETEWWVDKVNKVIHLSKASHGDPVVLEVGENVNTPSVTSSKEGYYTRFYAFGSTRNIVQDYKGANVNNLVNKRLTLDPVKYPGGYKDIRDNLSSDEIFSKVLILDDIYPSSKLKISDVRVRLMWTIDPDTKEKVQIGTDNEGNPIYDQYAIWYFQIPGFFFDNTAYDKDTNPQGMLIPGKTLSAHFQNGPLSGREFELKYHDKAESVDSADGAPIQIKKGDYEIHFVKEDSLVIPMINNLVPADGNEVVLFNIRMPEEYTTSAYLDLESALNKEIERLSSDLNNYQFNSNPVAFDNSNPKLSLGRNITYKNGTYSYSTRVIKLVTKLDFEIEQTITVGNEQIKGNTQEIKEEIASANKDINLLAILNSTTNSLTQAYSRTQQLMLEGFASIKDMWKFDPDNADTIFSKYNVYSKKALSAKGLAEGSGGGGGGASALYQLVDVIPNSAGTGVEGAQDRFTLIYDALAGKWKAGEAGLNENQLASYLSTNNYAKKTDIPSLAGYATEKWVTDKGYLAATASDKANWNAAYGWGNHTLAGYAKQTDLKTVSDKLNSFLSGESISDTIDNWKEFQKVFENFPDSANMVELLRGKVDITTSVKAGTGLTGGGPLSKDITLSLGETGVSVGTYTKLTVDKYGRVTSGTSLIASDIPSLAISKITGLQDSLNSKLNSNDFQSKFDAALAAWFVRDEGNKGIRPAAYQGEEVGFYSNTYLSAKGYASGSGGGGGGASALYQLLDVIPNASGTGVEGVADGYVLAYDALAGKWKAAQRLDETALKAYLTTNKYATHDWVSGQGYLTQHQSLANYVTLNTAQSITGIKTFIGSNFNFYHEDGYLNIVQKSSYTGGWARGLNFKNDNDTQYAVIGGYGNVNTFNYVYIGQSYDSRWITFASTGVKSSVDLEATKFKKTGGTSAQFLKADGSVDSNTYLTTGTASNTYVKVAGDTMTGKLSVPTLTISDTTGIPHVAFSRTNYNYITAPGNSSLAFVMHGKTVSSTSADFVITNNGIFPGTTGVVTNGRSTERWSNVFSVLGNFSGVITAGSHINAVGDINADGAITSGRDVVANNYVKSTNGWFQNDVAQAGLYNKAGDARWMWNGSYWYADKSIYSTNLIKGKTFESYVSTGTAPLVVASSTLVANLNANFVEGYSSINLLRRKLVGSTGDYKRYVILLFQTEEIANHRLDGYFYASNGGSNRYYRTDVSVWHSRWSSTAHDGTYSCINKNYQEGGLKLITVTYQGKEYIAMDSANTSIQAKNIYFVGDWTDNARFALVDYYNAQSSTVLNAEIRDSRKDLASDNILVGNNTIAYLNSNVASATKLQTARKIWGASFDGTSDIAGDISGATRIYNAANRNFYIGNSSNTGWVFTQNIASHDAINNWSIRTSGVGHFKRINLGDAEEDNTSYRLVIRGDQFMYGNIVSPWYRVNYSSNNPYYNLTKDNVTAYFQLYDTKAYLGFGTANSLNITQDGKVGIGIGTTNPSYKLHVAGTGYFSGSLTTSGNIATGSNDGAFVRIGNVYLQYDATNNAIKVVKYDGSSANLYATGGLSAKGLAEGSGGGGGGGLIQNVYGYTDLGKTYSNADLDNTFNAYTINQLATRITSLEGGSAMTFNTTGTGEFFSAVSKNGTTVTFTKSTPNYIKSSTTERDIKPNSTGSGLLKLYFVTGSNVGLTGGYADALFLNSYVDNSGGGSNLISFSKTNGEMALHYQSFNSTTWGARRVVLESVNYTNYTVSKTGGGASGTWGINITGNANSATSLQNIRYIGISGGATGSKTSFNGTYDITIPVTKIDPSKSYYENGKLLIKKIVGQYIHEATQTGIIKLTAPAGWTSAMVGIEIDVYNYTDSSGYTKILIGGYNYGGESRWINTSISILGNYSHKVRLAYDGSKCCILLGTTNSTWNYPKVVIRNIMSGYSGFASFDGNWTTSLITTESGLSSIVEPVVNTGMTVGIARGCSGNAATSSKWATARSISLTGAITGSVSLDGSSNVSLATTFADNVFDARYVKKSGDTMTGILTVNKSIILIQDWVRFNIAGRGLYNVSGDARWYWDGSSWYSDKNIFAAGNITGTRLMSNVAQGTSPLVVTSTTRVENLNADLLDNYHASDIATANTVVIRDANNYTYLKYINSSTNIAENGDLDQFIVTQPNDSFYRKYGRDYVRTQLNSFAVNRQTIDLSTLDANTYYPCSINVSRYESTTINIFVTLNSGTTPSWSTHTSGFTMNLSWQVFGGGWGSTIIQRKIFNDYYSNTSNGIHPCGGIEQNTMASTEIVYLRGGGKYFYTISNSEDKFEVNRSGYSWTSGNYSYSAPLISASKKSPSLCYEGNSMLGAYNIYANRLQVSSISVDGTITAATYKSGKSMFQDGQLELSGTTPYIDFHYGNSTADYTHRIIAETADRLNITTGLQVNGVLYGKDKLNIGSTMLSGVKPTTTNTITNVFNASTVLAMELYTVNKDSAQPLFRWANNISTGYTTRYSIGSVRAVGDGFGQLRLWVGNNDVGTAGNWFALNHNGVVSTSLTYFETSNTGFKTGNVVFGAKGSVAEISSATNHLLVSGYSDIHVNYTASGTGRTIPTKWYWHKGAANTWADFEIGALITHGNVTINGITSVNGNLDVVGDIGSTGGITSTRMLATLGGLDVTDNAMFNNDATFDGTTYFNDVMNINTAVTLNGDVALNGTIRGNSSSKIICDGIGISAGNKESGCIISGNPNSWSIAIDHNDIQARNNGAWSILYINDYGGDVSITNSSATYSAKILSTKASTSYTTGALTVGGGVGVGGSLYVRNNFVANGSIVAKEPSTSDIRLKNNIRDFNASLILKKIGKPFTFEWNSLARELNSNLSNEHQNFGVSAQRVKEVLPGFTFECYEGGYLGVKYDRFMPIVMAAQLETMGEVEILKREIKELKNRIKILEERG